MTLLEYFEALCKYVRECTGDDIVCGLCEYDAGTVGEEPIECPGFESNECFVLKESLRKQYEIYDQVIRCKDCRFSSPNGVYGCRIHSFADDLDKRMYADDYCSYAEMKED